MDIGATKFSDFLPFILNDISSSCFVAIDFELSGLAFPPNGPQINTQTVQERYTEAKAAAERYQILQVGLTICHENSKNVVYTLKPYNINLSPIAQPETEVNRDWTFGSRSMEFLLSHGFSIDTMCSSGVRYLSRVEEESAIKRATERCFRPTVPNIKIQEDDFECLEFLGSARLAINEWLAQGETRQSWLNIPPPTSLLTAPSEVPGALSNAQKRLLHQLISLEYPDLTSRGASTFVQIEIRNQQCEQISFEARLKSKMERVRNHIGFRWIVEALIGGNLEELDIEAFRPLMKKTDAPVLEIKQLADRMKNRLKQSRPVLVGHNLFCDLLFFHRCFIGPLPDTLGGFNAVIHNLFPVLADTKYLATHDCGALAPESSLEDLNRNLAHVEYPKIEINPGFTKYKLRKRTHEAGYDSMLAAMAFIKLAGNLQRNPAMFTQKVQQPTILAGPHMPPSLFASVMQPLDRRGSPNSEFSNFFYLESETPPEIDEKYIADQGTSLDDTGDRQIISLASRGFLVPRLGTVFWAIYGNKLRVFGTQERMIQVEPQPKVELLVDV